MMVVKEQQINKLGMVLSVEMGLDSNQVAASYLQFLAEDALPVIFYQRVPPIEEYLEGAKSKQSIWLGCYATSDEGRRMAGIGWVNHITRMSSEHIKAEVGMAFFRDFQRGSVPLEFAEMMIDTLFESMPELVSIYGLTPAPNRAALMFALRCGFKLQPPMPNYCCWKGELAPGVTSYMTREMWAGR